MHEFQAKQLIKFNAHIDQSTKSLVELEEQNNEYTLELSKAKEELQEIESLEQKLTENVADADELTIKHAELFEA